MWNEIYSQLSPEIQALFTNSHLVVSADNLSAILVCDSDQAVQFCSQLYFLTQIYPAVRKKLPSVRNLHVVSGSVYDLVTTSKAAFISIS